MNMPHQIGKQTLGNDLNPEESHSRANSAPAKGVPDKTSMIKDVWAENFEEEMKKMMKVVDKFPYVSLDTEYPGVLYNFEKKFSYHSVKCNVEQLKLIQVGLSFSDESGNAPEGITTWQFNFHFDLNSDKFAMDAINLLRESGINFEHHASRGIDPRVFAEYFTVSNIPFNEDVRWITFHPAFDFAYLMKLLSGLPLPPNEDEFDKELSVYFPTFYDVKYITKCFEKYGTLSRIASNFEIKRVGMNHLAGSDCHLASMIFFKMMDAHLRPQVNKYKNVIFRLDGEYEEPKDFYGGFLPEFTSHYISASGQAFMNFPHMGAMAAQAPMRMHPFYADMGMPKMDQGQGNPYVMYNGGYPYQE